MRRVSTQSQGGPHDESDISLLEFDALITSPQATVDGLRAHITQLVEGIDKESTLVSLVRFLESDRNILSGPSMTTTITDLRSGETAAASSSTSTLNIKISLNCDSGPSINEAQQSPIVSVIAGSIPVNVISTTIPLLQERENEGEVTINENKFLSHQKEEEEKEQQQYEKNIVQEGDDENDEEEKQQQQETEVEEEIENVKVENNEKVEGDDSIFMVVSPPWEHKSVPHLIHGRRAAVSAEPLPLDAIESFTPPIVKKTPEEEKVVRSGVMVCHIFSNMDSNDRAIIVKALKRETYSAGVDILTQGGASLEKLFLITEGTCQVIKNGKLVHTLDVGSTFGEMEMMYHQPICAATIRTVTNCIIYTLDQCTYQHIVLAVSVHKRKKYEQLLLNVKFLETLPDYSRMSIAEALVTKTYRQGDYIIRFGEMGKWMYIIVEGEVTVVGRHLGKKKEILRLKEGDVVGELEFVFNHLSVADVIVSSKRVITAQIQRKHFELITGPIQDHLKEYVVNSGIYTHYLGEANENIRNELGQLGKRSKRMATKAERENTLLDQVDIAGEIVLPAPKEKVIMTENNGKLKDDNNNNTNIVNVKDVNSTGLNNTRSEITPPSPYVLFRFPLTPLHNNSLAMIGLREDGSIIVWNEMMTRLTGYTSNEAVGQHISSFLLETKDQKKMHETIFEARQYTGDVEAFFEEKGMGRRTVYTFARIDGLTKVCISLSIVPSIVSHGKDAAEIMLAVGEEQRINPQSAFDKSQLLVDQISTVLGDGEITYEDRLHRISSVLSSFDSTCRAITASTEDIQVVNIRQMLGQVIMDYGAQCVESDVAVRQRFEGLYAENVYLNAKSLPECLRYVMSNCTSHIDSGQVTITVSIKENNGIEFLVIEFHDDGPGFPENILKDFKHRRISEKNSQLHRVRLEIEKQGGSMSIFSKPGNTIVSLAVPFVPVQEKTKVYNAESLHDPNDASWSFAVGGTFEHESITTSTGVTTPTSSNNNNINNIRPNNTRHTFTTLVVEDTPAHRNMLCSFLWDRKHAVLPAYNLEDMEHLIKVADILFVDPHQSIFGEGSEAFDPISFLRDKTRQMAVVITGSDMDESNCKAYHTAGFITLKKPCTSIEASHCIRKAEDMILKYKLEAERIVLTRETLSKNSRGAWTRGKLLGKGSYGSVYEATEVLTGGKMAVKEMQLGKHNQQIEHFVNEISTMCNLHHPNIIHYFYCEEKKEENVIRVFMEYAAGGTLQQLLQKKGKLEFKEYQSLLRDIVEGVAYIHSMHYVHGDLKTANILLSTEGKGKIGDFGTARVVADGELLYQMQGSPLYMSPECMSASDKDEDGVIIGYSFPSDIWSLGCIALEMATNKPPFSYLKNIKGPMGLMNYITNLHDIPDLSPLFDGPPSIVEFVSACLNPDASKRATATQLLNISLFSEATDDDMKSALQSLKRAQLLHVLNSYVAFQEPEDAERRKSLFRRRYTNRRESEFFASSHEGDDSGHNDEENSYTSDDSSKKEIEKHEKSRLTKVNKEKENNDHDDLNHKRLKAIDTDAGTSLASSCMEPAPVRRSRTKSKSCSRTHILVNEEHFFASSSSSRSSLSSFKKRRDATATTRAGFDSNDDNNKEDDISEEEQEREGNFEAELKEEKWNEKHHIIQEEQEETPSPLAFPISSFAFINRSIAFMGKSIDEARAGTAFELLKDQQEKEKVKSYSPSRETRFFSFVDGNQKFERTLRHSSSLGLLGSRQPKRITKNLFSVEDLEALPRESSPDAVRPNSHFHKWFSPVSPMNASYTSSGVKDDEEEKEQEQERVHSHNNHSHSHSNSNKNNYFQQLRRFAVAAAPISHSPSPAIDSSGPPPSTSPSSNRINKIEGDESSSECKSRSEGGALNLLHHTVLEILTQLKERSVGSEFVRQRSPSLLHYNTIKEKEIKTQQEEKKEIEVGGSVKMMRELMMRLEKQILELKSINSVV